MKKILLIVFSICLAWSVFGQLSSGTYVFKSGDPNFHWEEYYNYGPLKYQDFVFTVSIDGWDIKSIQFNEREEVLKDGYWRTVNTTMMATLDEDYDGPFGWYEFQTNQCNYTFDEPQNGRIILQRYDCIEQCDDQTIGLTLIRRH